MENNKQRPRETAGSGEVTGSTGGLRISFTHCSLFSRRRQWPPTPGLSPGKSHGRRSLVGSRRVGHDWATSLSLFTFMHIPLYRNSKDGGSHNHNQWESKEEIKHKSAGHSTSLWKPWMASRHYCTILRLKPDKRMAWPGCQIISIEGAGGTGGWDHILTMVRPDCSRGRNRSFKD